MKSILICVLLLSMSHVEAKRFYAKVIMLKGKVSKLAPGDRNASWIKKGDILKDDTSLYSEKGSFARIQILKDKSYVTLGPKSKLVLNKIKKNKGSVLSVLTGTIRAKVNKKRDSADKKSKLYIKSQTAVMGVRGTELVVAVNQENKVTSLVTLEGEVAMARVDEGPTVEPVEQVVEEAVDNAPPEEVETVAKGRASTAYQHKEEVTPPTKVNPVQLVALKQNENMDDKIKKNAKPIKVTEEMKKDLYAPDTEEEKKEGRDKVPENGGVVDLNSGIFIPPVEKDMDIGKVDPSTGRFVAANDIKLDPVKGFVAKADTKEAKEKAEALNKKVEYKELPKNYAPSRGHVARTPVKRERTYDLSVLFGAGATKIVSLDDTTEFSEFLTTYFNIEFMARFPSIYGFNYLLGLDVSSQGFDPGEDYDKNEDDSEGSGTVLRGGVELLLGANSYYVTVGQTLTFTPELQGQELIQSKISNRSIDLGMILKMSQNWDFKMQYTNIFAGYTDDEDSLVILGGHQLRLEFERALGSKGEHRIGIRVNSKHTEWFNNLQEEESAQLKYKYRF
jgi:ferric-dicitrate binding protein FerR (iron transport regulator)